MHGDPLRVCHRDVKPENILVTEPPDAEPLVKLTDFDLAVAQAPGERCRRPCGTMPFTAPEVVLEQSYCGFAADVWSMAVVVLEVQCGLHVLESATGLPRVSNETTVQITKEIKLVDGTTAEEATQRLQSTNPAAAIKLFQVVDDTDDALQTKVDLQKYCHADTFVYAVTWAKVGGEYQAVQHFNLRVRIDQVLKATGGVSLYTTESYQVPRGQLHARGRRVERF